MGKPSIFSKNYETLMKRRKRRISLTIIISIVVIISVVFYSGIRIWVKNNFEAVRQNYRESLNTETQTDTTKDDVIDPEIDPETDAENDVVDEEKFYPITLEDGTSIKVYYSEEDNNIIYNNVESEVDSISYDISLKADKIVLLNPNSQTIYIIDKDGKSENITNLAYVSKDYGTFKKQDILAEKSKYIWVSEPRFVSDKLIAYKSQLPWFDNRETNYLWLYDISSKNHIYKREVSGTVINFGEITEKGLEIKADSKIYYINEKGIISNK
ncbi:MAG: hypothetical protein ACERKV_07095 [Clostridiaceae bacterium]